jgi:hypothetical protein
MGAVVTKLLSLLPHKQEEKVMADIKVNKQQWDALSEQEQNAITDGLRSKGSLRDDDRIVGDPDVAAFDEKSQLGPMWWNPIGDICRAGCDTVAAGAAAWCTANTAGAGLLVCLAAAEAARQECRSHC